MASNVTNIRIVLIDDDGTVVSALDGYHRAGDTSFFMIECKGMDDGLLAVADRDPDVCVISDPDGSGNAHKLLDGIREAGLNTAVVVRIDAENPALESEFLKSGALGVIPTNEMLGSALRITFRMALSLKHEKTRFRDDKNEIVARMYELQDARERAEEQSSQMVDMAENLAVTKNELEKLNHEKTRFFSIIAHDLKSPFNALLGYTELLAISGKNLSPDKVQDFASNINDSANRVFALLENLLTWTHTQMNTTGAAPQPTKIVDITDRSIEALTAVAENKTVKLESKIAEEIGYVDPNMIETVIRNLINNAIKFTNHGGHVQVSAETIDGPDNHLIEISVRDDGIGMSAERTSNLFSPSESLSTYGTDGEKGTGLGLMLCKELVERNGGNIRVTSAPGEGSTFSFTVPTQ